ncbi:hypothetical protein AX17_006411 [Amanita inopinata Kibby_2008]|nr:hypothetical protein AX17_006411 [Amanita inopinata Kibby_2008]
MSVRDFDLKPPMLPVLPAGVMPPAITAPGPPDVKPGIKPESIETFTSTPAVPPPPPQTAPSSEQDGILIAVMGATGSGKTTFINLASGSQMRIGRGLQSCTSNVQVSPPFQYNGRWVTLIDTPGFDDTTKSDTEILRMISLYLSTTYERGKKLSGVLYFHRISDFRMGGISRRNFNMFRELCGDENLKNVIIVTNMWKEVDPDVGVARETELISKDIFFKPALDKGAMILRHNNILMSAQYILKYLVRNRPAALRIQEELVDQKKEISQTAAGKELNKELLEQAERHRKELLTLQEEVEAAIKAKDEETRKELEIETKKLQEEMTRIQQESSSLSANFKKDKLEMEQRMKEIADRAQRDAEEAYKQHQKQMLALQEQLQQTETNMTTERNSLQQRLDRMRDEYNRGHSGGVFSMIGRALDSVFGF